MPANSKASQLLNGFGNFMNGVSNAARDVVANPIADIANVGLKTNPYVAAANLVTNGKVNKAIDTVTSAAKGEQPKSLQKQPEDPTSLAYAAGEGLTRGIDAAASVLTLTDLARQLPKAAQAGWKTILNKVKDAKSKSQQMKLAKEAREYLNKAMDENLRPKVESAAPAYQQRAVAEYYNDRNLGPKMDNYVNDKYTYSNAEFKNMTNKMNSANMSKDPEAVKMRTARNEVYPANVDYSATKNNKTYKALSKETARDIDVPYKGINKDYYNSVKKEIDDLVKMSDKDFKELMQSKSSASWAGYDDWRYNLGDDRINNWNKPKEYQRMKSQVIENILNDAGLAYGKPGVYGDAIKSNAIKSNKRYRNWLKKEAKNTYEKNTQPITRAERNAADMNTAEVEKKEIMKQYGISSKDYDEYADAAANTYIYIDKNGNPVNQMAGAGWPGGGEYFIDESKEVMPYLKGYAKRHPTVDEYIRMAEEEAELGRLAEAEAEDIAREAGPAYDSDRYKNWSL